MLHPGEVGVALRQHAVLPALVVVEARAFRWLNNIGSPETATSVVSLGWVEDGIDPIEVKAIEEISYIDYGDARVASSVVSLGWVQNGIEDLEVDLIDALASIAIKAAGEALRIVSMPFLETIEPPDASAMESLRLIAAFRPEAFASVMSHAALRDGISDDVAPIVATLDGVARTNPGLIDILLDPSRVLVERRVITLPLSGDVVLDIIRMAPGAARLAFFITLLASRPPIPEAEAWRCDSSLPAFGERRRRPDAGDGGKAVGVSPRSLGQIGIVL